MPVTFTSLDAYKSIKDSLGYRQKQVFNVIMKRGDVTNLEISTQLRVPINQVTPRTNELVDFGLVIENVHRECSISGRVVTSWRIR